MTQTGHFLFCQRKWVDRCERSAAPIREYTIRKIIKTEFLPQRVFIDFSYCVSRPHPLPPKDTPHFKSAVFLWFFNSFNCSKIPYSKNTNFYHSSNSQDFQGLLRSNPPRQFGLVMR